MSRHAEITIEWADGEYTFRLGIGEIRKLQERCNAGPYAIFDRIAKRTFMIDDLRETIRLGLQGGRQVVSAQGLPDDTRINRLIRDYVDERPMTESMLLAARILDAAISGAPDEPFPKSKGAASQPKNSQTANSPSPSSMDGDRPSATALPI